MIVEPNRPISSVAINSFFTDIYKEISILDEALRNNQKENTKQINSLQKELFEVNSEIVKSKEITNSYLDKKYINLKNYIALGDYRSFEHKNVCTQFEYSILQNTIVKSEQNTNELVFNNLNHEYVTIDIKPKYSGIYRLMSFDTNLMIQNIYIYSGNTPIELENPSYTNIFPSKKVTKFRIIAKTKDKNQVYYIKNINLKNLKNNIIYQKEFNLNLDCKEFALPFISQLHSYKLFDQSGNFISHLHEDYSSLCSLLIDYQDNLSEEISFIPSSLALYEDGYVLNPNKYSFIIDGREFSEIPAATKRIKKIQIKYPYQENKYYHINYIPGRSIKGIKKQTFNTLSSLLNKTILLTTRSNEIINYNNLILRYSC